MPWLPKLDRPRHLAEPASPELLLSTLKTYRPQYKVLAGAITISYYKIQLFVQAKTCYSEVCYVPFNYILRCYYKIQFATTMCELPLQGTTSYHKVRHVRQHKYRPSRDVFFRVASDTITSGAFMGIPWDLRFFYEEPCPAMGLPRRMLFLMFL